MPHPLKQPGLLPGPALSRLSSYPVCILDVRGFHPPWWREWLTAIFVMQQIISLTAKLITSQGGVNPGGCIQTHANLESGDFYVTVHNTV